MQISYKLNTTRSAEVSALKDFHTFLNSAHSAGKDLAILDSSEVQSLRGIAESTTAGLAAQKAQNAVCFFYAICYDPQGQPALQSTWRYCRIDILGSQPGAITYCYVRDTLVSNTTYALIFKTKNNIIQ